MTDDNELLEEADLGWQDATLRIPVGLDSTAEMLGEIEHITDAVRASSGVPQPSRIIEPVTPDTVFRAGDRVRAAQDSDAYAVFRVGDWLTVRGCDLYGYPILERDDDGEDCGWGCQWFDLIERAAK